MFRNRTAVAEDLHETNSKAKEPKEKKVKEKKVTPKEKKVKERGPSYPFKSKKQLVEQVSASTDFAVECLRVLFNRQTPSEQEGEANIGRNRVGFMSSHLTKATTLYQKVTNGTATPEDLHNVQELVSHYGRQLAEHFRQQAIESNPDLAKIAKVFSAG